ncbi:MAG: type VI secretion system Vgr family protein, partial [Nannocystaceae bacterium]
MTKLQSKGHRGGSSKQEVLHLVIEPAAALLRLEQQSRVFQDMALPAIAEQVLRDGLKLHGRNVESRLMQTYPKREMVVQYEESNAAFVARILAEAGVHSFFEFPDSGVEKLVLVDGMGNDGRVGSLAGEGNLVVAGEDVVRGLVEGIESLEVVAATCPTGVVARGYDWTRPDITISQTVGEAKPGRTRVFQNGGVALGAYGSGMYRGHEAAQRAEVAFGQSTAEGLLLRGRSNSIGLTPGMTIQVHGHQYREFDSEFVVTEVAHSGQVREAEHQTFGSEEAPEYTNLFCCVPIGRPCPRPPASKPQVTGVQTATVVGPQGEEIFTDEHGRVRVRFHWDLVESEDSRASCWVRVGQGWSGAGFGALVVPRVGTEVVVSFINGDPDRPLILGSVYNGANRPPSELPAQASQSVFRTQTTPGGGGFNELRFEDRRGAERVSVHAQRDLTETVRNDHVTQVYGNQRNVVEKGQVESIGTDQSTAIAGHRVLFVGTGDEIIVEGGRDIAVSGPDVTAVQGPRETVVGASEQHRVVESYDHIVGGNRRDRVAGVYDMHLEKTGRVRCTDGWLTQSPAYVHLACCEDESRGEHAAVALDPSQASVGFGRAQLVVRKSGEVELH